MLTLDQLKAKWFINVIEGGTPFPPCTRLPRSAIAPWTDGNLVTPLLDGQNFMLRWYNSIQQMILDQPSTCELWLAGWRLEDVCTLGTSDPSSDALGLIIKAHSAGVSVYGLLSNHLPGMVINLPSVIRLGKDGIDKVLFDNRFPPVGSGHQKFTCMRKPTNPHCILGSIDMAKTRWDTQKHLAVDPNRDSAGKPTHDTGVMVNGPAVADLEITFKERWNDPTNITLDRNIRPIKVPLTIESPVSAPSVAGTHSVQVLRTYARNVVTGWKYSWSEAGEFSIWAAYVNALAKALKYIYIEDQYFLPFGWPPYCKSAGSSRARDTDLVYQLGEAIRQRGVKVLVVTPSNDEDPWHVYQKFQRDVGIEYLKGVNAGVTNGGDFVVASLTNGTTPVYVHSKLMIVDDEFALIGSANFGQRSMTYDSEVQLGIVDSSNLFAKELRKSLWAEHLMYPPASVEDIDFGYDAFKLASTSTPTGRVEPYPFEVPATPPHGHGHAIAKFIEPYGGPLR